MENFLFYFFKASIGIFLFFLLYQLILRKETYYASNRIYLVMGLILAVLLPIIPITYISPVALVNNSEFFSIGSSSVQELPSSVTSIQEEESFWQIPYIISAIYVVGAIIFLLRLLLQSAFLIVKYQLGEKSQIDGITVINLKHKTMPFSFFKVVFINIQAYSKEELSNIIAHEKVHIQERHWVDLLIVELLTVVFWMNPIVWLYERSIKQNHEYLADQGVLLAGYHPGRYQALLINQFMGANVMGFTNNLNFSLNKKRMEMMKKEKSTSLKKAKLILMMPVIALLIFAFAQPEYVMVEARKPSSAKSISDKGKIIKVKGTIKTENDIPLPGTNIWIEGITERIFADEKGKFTLDVPEGSTLRVSYVGYETQHVTINASGKAKEVVNVEMKKGVINYEFLIDINLDEKNVVGFAASEIKPNESPAVGDDKFLIVEKIPVYKGGHLNKLAQDILDEAQAVMKKTQDRGTSTIGFIVLSDGKVENVQVIESSGSQLLDESALIIISKLNNWEPGIQNGKKVPASVTVPVNFN